MSVRPARTLLKSLYFLNYAESFTERFGGFLTAEAGSLQNSLQSWVETNLFLENA